MDHSARRDRTASRRLLRVVDRSRRREDPRGADRRIPCRAVARPRSPCSARRRWGSGRRKARRRAAGARRDRCRETPRETVRGRRAGTSPAPTTTAGRSVPQGAEKPGRPRPTGTSTPRDRPIPDQPRSAMAGWWSRRVPTGSTDRATAASRPSPGPAIRYRSVGADRVRTHRSGPRRRSGPASPLVPWVRRQEVGRPRSPAGSRNDPRWSHSSGTRSGCPRPLRSTGDSSSTPFHFVATTAPGHVTVQRQGSTVLDDR